MHFYAVQWARENAAKVWPSSFKEDDITQLSQVSLDATTRLARSRGSDPRQVAAFGHLTPPFRRLYARNLHVRMHSLLLHIWHWTLILFSRPQLLRMVLPLALRRLHISRDTHLFLDLSREAYMFIIQFRVSIQSFLLHIRVFHVV